jgi:hypothetical protein
VPYELHSGRELEFMLTRGKPLAHFSDAYPPEPDEEIIPQRAFAPYVRNSIFEMRAFVQLLDEAPPNNAPHVKGVLHVFYAARQESWRIDAFIELINTAERDGWSEVFERREGTLLGYSSVENDIHIDQLLNSPRAKNFPWLRRLLAERSR